jgi:hypothetical protein
MPDRLASGPNCWDCRYLRITWDTRHPYGCQFMGFQSRMLPCLEVMRADGRPCGAFVPKALPNTSANTAANTVGQTSPRQETDRRGLAGGINIIT